MSSHLWIGFTGGLLAFAHCLGMCGGFVLHLSQQPGRKAVANQLLWQTGRLTTYIFLGAVAGYSGQILKGLLQHSWLQNAFSYLSGAVILLMGLAVLGILPVTGKQAQGETMLSGFFGTSLFMNPSPGSALVLGMTTGCLPCPLVIGFLAYAVQTQAVMSGMAVMAGMGFGTVVPLLLLGAFGGTLNRGSRRWARWGGGTILIVLGIVTILRGSTAFHHLLGCPSPPAAVPTGATATPPCCEGHGSAGKLHH